MDYKSRGISSCFIYYTIVSKKPLKRIVSKTLTERERSVIFVVSNQTNDLINTTRERKKNVYVWLLQNKPKEAEH